MASEEGHRSAGTGLEPGMEGRGGREWLVGVLLG